MKDVFESRAIDVEELVSGDNFDISQQIRRVLSGLANPRFDRATRNAYLMDQLAMRRNFGQIGAASQNVDSATFKVVALRLIPKQRAGRWIGDPASGTVAIE